METYTFGSKQPGPWRWPGGQLNGMAKMIKIRAKDRERERERENGKKGISEHISGVMRVNMVLKQNQLIINVFNAFQLDLP